MKTETEWEKRGQDVVNCVIFVDTWLVVIVRCQVDRISFRAAIDPLSFASDAPLRLVGCHLRKMRRIWIDSTSIASIGYEAAARELEIEFRDSRDVYRYFDVPEEEYAALLAAGSRGSYFNEVFRERNYRYLLVSRGT